ncbi:NAD(P)/FAD-dependent oxidoreductase [Noviherbaspirillum aerium]|uniref:NAD(P)/FAD-dependent oxidoreductase n=1 Tax=Noviherbaspirillum aerium TaxID=2588497 RepID=UPI00124DC0E2|nr:NAD(P)/FAD-dependent oxidoreductase [Noviherbaspirillum aerium]
MKSVDCLIIGGGAAGLTAAVYLARFRRRVEVVDGGTSRLLQIPTSHNYPGYRSGIHGNDILSRLHAQVEEYDVPVVRTVIDTLRREEDGSFTATAGDLRWQARSVILATGVVDVEPAFAEVKQAVAKGCLRYCPVCDGFEASGRSVGVIGHGKGGLGEAAFVSHFASSVSLFTLEEAIDPDPDEQARLERARVQVVHEPVAGLSLAEAGGMRIELRDGTRHCVDIVYAALGTTVNSGLAQLLGARQTAKGELLVDEHQQTSVDGLYAAGDIVAGLNQITVAQGQAAIAATAIHNRLNAWHD